MSDGNSRDSDIREAIRRNRVFVLGSGFSAAAGIPLTAQLLHKTMALFRADNIGLFERFEGYVQTCFGLGDASPDYARLSLSELCTYLEYVELREYGGGERWSDAGSREKLTLQFYLAKAIVQATPSLDELPPLYIRFARLLRRGDIVICFNWDTLLEASLDAVGSAYTYNFGDTGVWLVKPHGSIHWRFGVPNNPVLEWSPVGLASGMMPEEVYRADALRSAASWGGRLPLGEVQPLLVLPGFGKAFDVRRLATLWYKPEWAFAFTHDVYVIGLALARDDFIVRSFLLDNLPYIESLSGVPGRRVVVVNPDPLARDNYAFLVGSAHVSFLCEPFSEAHVELIEKRSEELGSVGRSDAV